MDRDRHEQVARRQVQVGPRRAERRERQRRRERQVVRGKKQRRNHRRDVGPPDEPLERPQQEAAVEDLLPPPVCKDTIEQTSRRWRAVNTSIVPRGPRTAP